MDTVVIKPLLSEKGTVLIRLGDVPEDWEVREYDVYKGWVPAPSARLDHHPSSIFEARPTDPDTYWEWIDKDQPPYDVATEPSATA
jgi:hypothetical protein